MNKNVIDAMNSINSIDRLQDEAYLDVHNAIMESQNKYEIIKEHGTVEYAQNEFYQESVLAGVLIGLGVIGLIASTILIIKKVNETSGKGSGKGTATPDKPAADMNLFESKSIEDKQKEFKTKVDEILKKIGNTDEATRDRIFEIANCKQKLNGPAITAVADAMDKVADQLENFANQDPNEDSYAKEAESIIEEIGKLNKSIEANLNSLIIDIGEGVSISTAIDESFTIAASISDKLKKYDDKLSKVEPKLKALSEKAKEGKGGEGSDANNQNAGADLEALQKKANDEFQPMSKDNHKFFETIRGFFNNVMSNVNKADYSQLTQPSQPAQESQPTHQPENQPVQTQGAETPTEETSDDGTKPTTITAKSPYEEKAEKWVNSAKESEARAKSENNTRETAPAPAQQTATPEQPGTETTSEETPTTTPANDGKTETNDLTDEQRTVRDKFLKGAKRKREIQDSRFDKLTVDIQNEINEGIKSLPADMIKKYASTGSAANVYDEIVKYMTSKEQSEAETTPEENPKTEGTNTETPTEKPEQPVVEDKPKDEKVSDENPVDEGDKAVFKLGMSQGVMLTATLMSLVMANNTTDTTEKVAEEVKKEEETVENVSAEEIQKTAEESNAAIVKAVGQSTFNIKHTLLSQLDNIKNSERLKQIGNNIATVKGYFVNTVKKIKASKTAAKHKDITDGIEKLITTLDNAEGKITSQGIEVPDSEEMFNNIEETIQQQAAAPGAKETPAEHAEEPKDEKPSEEEFQSIATAFGKSVDEVKADYDKMHTGEMSSDDVRAQIDANVKDPRTQGYYKKIFKRATGDTVNGTIVAPAELGTPAVTSANVDDWKVKIDESNKAMYVPVIPTFSDPAELVNYTKQIVTDLPQLYKQCIDAKSINNADDEVNINNITYKKITPNEFENSEFMDLIREFTGHGDKLIKDINAAKEISDTIDRKLVVMGSTVAEVLENLKSIYNTFEMWYAQLIRFVTESYNFTALDKSMDDTIKELKSLTTNVTMTQTYVDRVKEFRLLRAGKPDPNTNMLSGVDPAKLNRAQKKIADFKSFKDAQPKKSEVKKIDKNRANGIYYEPELVTRPEPGESYQKSNEIVMDNPHNQGYAKLDEAIAAKENKDKVAAALQQEKANRETAFENDKEELSHDLAGLLNLSSNKAKQELSEIINNKPFDLIKMSSGVGRYEIDKNPEDFINTILSADELQKIKDVEAAAGEKPYEYENFTPESEPKTGIAKPYEYEDFNPAPQVPTVEDNEKLNEQPVSVTTQQAAATPAPTEEPKKKGFAKVKETVGNVGKAIKSIFTKESYEEYILPSGEMTMVLVEYEVTEYEDGSTEKRRIRIINE